MARRRDDRARAWRPFAALLELEASDLRRVRERIERLDLPPAERARVLDLLERHGR